MVSDKVELIIQQHNQKQLSRKETAGHESQERKTENQQGETIQQHIGQSAQKGGGRKLTWGWQSPVPSHGGGPCECCDLRTCSLWAGRRQGPQTLLELSPAAGSCGWFNSSGICS